MCAGSTPSPAKVPLDPPAGQVPRKAKSTHFSVGFPLLESVSLPPTGANLVRPPPEMSPNLDTRRRADAPVEVVHAYLISIVINGRYI